MSKKPNGRFLLTWNEKKHPEITTFFDEIEEGLYSHTLRKVIKIYMEQKGAGETKSVPVSNKSNFTEELGRYNNDHSGDDEKSNNDDYVDFNPDDMT